MGRSHLLGLSAWLLCGSVALAQEDGASLDAPPVLSPMRRLEARITAAHWERCAGSSEPVEILVERASDGRVSVVEAPETPSARCLARALEGAMAPARGMRSGVRNRLRFPSGSPLQLPRFEPSGVVAAVRAHLREIQVCYERTLRRKPRIRGMVTVELTIEEHGVVSRSEVVENTTGDEPMATCVAAAVGAMTFASAPTGGSVDFSYPFVFAPAE